MKHCPKCKTQYPDDMSYCLIDGGPLLVNDPEAETLKGRVVRPSKIRPIQVNGEAIQHLVWLTKDKPYSLIYTDVTIILLLKDFLEKTSFAPKSKGAHIAFYGNRPFQEGGKVQAVAHNEYFMPEWDEQIEQDISVFYLELSNGYSTLFRAYVSEVQPKRVRMNLGLLITKPTS